MAICNKVVDPNCTITSANSTHYVNNVIQTAFSLFMLVGVIFFIYQFVMAGFHFITSEGDPKKVEEAKHEITYAFIGIIIIFSVFAILRLLGTVFSIPQLDSLTLSWPHL